ncbi:metallophosphoesterase [Clostridium sp. 19966]|uniref:metallophosphoesterase family protein n=1 Tax=Clostridium sp. 19966 TaxID=2768166 RepID=UPI0028DD5714|nr:metallophosphoesterase [Clostridium sp. 19966]MDT8719070.1 metallophosphoesterase [Clostridium sp. 19966]
MFCNYCGMCRENFRFLVMGDSRGKKLGINAPVLENLLSNSSKYYPNFMIFLGDMVSEKPNVSTNLNNWKQIISKYYPIRSCFPCIGNHENDETAFNNAFNYLPNEQLESYGRTVYYFDFQNSRFIILNSCRRDIHGNYLLEANQLHWLDSVLQNNTATFSFVALHTPPYPTGSHFKDSLDTLPETRDYFWSIIDKYNVNTVFCGHEHNYSRRLIDNSFSENNFIFKNNIFQIISGGAGAPLSNTLISSHNIVVGPLAVYHYIIVDVSSSEVIFNAYDINNNILDSFKLSK